MPFADYKRIILCVDGTWLAADLGNKEKPSNVASIARAIAPTGIDENGDSVRQIVLYHSGLGAEDLPGQKALYGAFGWGLDADVSQVYDFISNNYEPGDELFFFGFSRGAYTVRTISGLISDIGVMAPVNMSHFAGMWKAYRNNTDGDDFKSTTWYRKNAKSLDLKRPVPIQLVGVWDTVGELGVPDYWFVKVLQKIGIPINKQYSFHNTKLSNGIKYAYGALALDERRTPFPPTLWRKPLKGTATEVTGETTTEMCQCWFPGIHGNIGGQADDPTTTGDRGEIGYNTLAWMVDNTSKMLTYREEAIRKIIEDHEAALNQAPDWGSGPIASNFAGLTGFFFRFLGAANRQPGNYSHDPSDNVSGATNEFFHPLVRYRQLKLKSGWNPVSMQGWEWDFPDTGGPRVWSKKNLPRLSEYVLHPEKKLTVACRDNGVVSFKTVDSLSRTLCPPSILSELDKDNGL